MKKCFVCVVLSSIIILTIVLASCTPESTPTPTTAEPTATPTATTTASANWWDKFGEPQYGGMLNLAVSSLGDQFDLSQPLTSNYFAYDTLFMWDLTIPRDEFSFKAGYPTENVGLMAETWEWPDTQTLVVHIRHGIKWHNRPPTNGREFTADDVIYHYDRIMGTGHGFTEPNPMTSHFLLPYVASISAEDEYTVVFKFKEATPLINSWTIVSSPSFLSKIEPREFVELGNPSEWQSCSGTGPFMVTDFVSGSSITMSKNPDYYRYDDRYPDNLLPYLDTLKLTYILDQSTRVAALRTGQVDLVNSLDWLTAQTLGETNPELVITSRPDDGMVLDLRNDTEPFNDIRVRKALQLAIDIPTIAKTHFGGYVSSNPPGFLCADQKGWTLPYEEWPQELKDEYSYNPEKARELLAEAGYPGGFDTNCYIANNEDTELLEILKSYFADIGVDMTINSMDRNALTSLLSAGLHDQMAVNGFWNMVEPVNISFHDRTSQNATNYVYAAAEEAAVYDDLYQQFARALDEAAAQKLVLQAEDYQLRQHWVVVTTGRVKFDAAQPRLKGYSGENMFSWSQTWFWPTLWVDQE